MTRIWIIAFGVGASLFSFATNAQAQTTEQLLEENRRLQAQIHRMQEETKAQYSSFNYFDDDQHGGSSHGHDDSCWCDECGHGHHDFDYFDAYHHRHETAGGYPFFEMLVTEHAFIERKVRLDYVSTNGADGGEVDEDELEFEFFWAVNNRLAVFVEAPYAWLNPESDPNTSGFGDLEAGFRFVAFDGEYTIVTFGLNVATPTGDSDRDLGSGHTSLEPVMLMWHDLGCGWVFQGELAFEIPVSVRDPENEFHYNFALSRTLLGTCDWCYFQYLTPLIELNGVTEVNGPTYGETVINVTPGVRWAVNETDHAGFGFSFPVTNEEKFESKFILSYIHHFH